MCVSLRGAVYCGASFHLTLGAVLFVRYVIVTAFLTFFNVTDVIKDRITGYLLPFVAYITLFLAFGIVIFHSVEKEYFIILRWATLGFTLLQLVVLVALYTLKFVPASTYEYRQFPFLPVSITEGYVNTGFQTTDVGGPGSSTIGDSLSGENYYAENLPKLTRGPGTGVYPTSSTSGSSSGSSNGRQQHHHGGDKSGSSEVLKGLEGGGGSGDDSGSELDFIHPVPTAPPNKWLGEVYSLIALIVMTVVSLVYLVLLFIYVRQLIYEDSGHVFGHAQSVTRNVAFYVQPQFAQSGNSDNKLTNSPSPALRNKAPHSSQQANCTQQPVSNTHCQQIPSEFLPQPQNLNQQQPQQRHQVGNHLKPGSNIDPNSTLTKDTSHHQQCTQQQNQQSGHSQQQQSQNHIHQRSPVPPAREMQQNIQNQQQQQVITIYPQKGGGFTSSSSSPRMQVKFAKPLEQHPSHPSGSHAQPHIHSGDSGSQLPEPTRSCLANPPNMQQQQQQHPSNAPSSAHMMPPPPPPRSQSQRLDSSGRGLPPPCSGGQFQPMHGQPPPPPPHQNIPQSHQNVSSPHQHLGNPPPPIPHHQPPPGGFPPQHIQGQPGPAYTHHQAPPQPPQHMPYHGKSRAQQQTYSDMVDNSSYLVFSGNPNSSNVPPPNAPPSALHPSHLASASHTYPHCSQRRPSGSMV